MKLEMVWINAPAMCSQCEHQLRLPGIAGAGEDGGLWCPDCARRALQGDGKIAPEGLFDNPETRSVVVFSSDRVICGSCDHYIWHSPGFVPIGFRGLVCCLTCLGNRDPTVTWLLKVACNLREIIGFWPGASSEMPWPPMSSVAHDEAERRWAQERVRKFRAQEPDWWREPPIPDRRGAYTRRKIHTQRVTTRKKKKPE